MTERSDDFWAITSYFNPLSYRNRQANYRVFRERLQLRLVTVELAYGPRFELGEGDADILIQLRGGDVLWQKERLLNLALDALPPQCTKIAWIDCDLVFANDAWPAAARRTLDAVPVAQAFSEVRYLNPGAMPGDMQQDSAEASFVSIATAVASGLDARSCFDEANGRVHGRYMPGLAWVARREVLQRHGFYDACIIGGGDRAISSAFYGCFEHPVNRHGMTQRQAAHYRAWAEPIHSDVGGAIGVVEGQLFHLWHGALKHRRWHERYSRLQAFRFDPRADVALTGNGLWRWNSDKLEMHAYVREHFASRREDG